MSLRLRLRLYATKSGCGKMSRVRSRVSDVQVRGMRLCRGTNFLRKQLEIRLIFQLGTVQPDSLNINFKYV